MSDTVPKPRQPRASRVKPLDEVPDNGSNGSNGIPEPESAPPKPPRAAPPKGARKGSLEARLTEFISVAAIPFSTVGDDYSATIIAQRAPNLAANLAALADENPSIKRALTRMLEGGAWGGVALAFASIVIPITQRYGAIPGNDPFQFLYPGSPQMPSRGIASPPAGFAGWSQEPAGQASAMGAPVPPDSGGATPPAAVSVIPPNGDDTIPQFIPGAPPGVVTVAATAAGHNGAR